MRTPSRQRGIADGWLYLIGIIVLLTILTWIGTAIYRAGAKSERAEWQEREAKINAAIATKIEAANKRVREAEQSIASQVADAATEYQRALKGKDDALNIALNSLRAGTGRLFVSATCPAPGGNTADSAAAGAGRRDGAAGTAILGEADSTFLLAEASRADGIVHQLAACQAVVRADRGQ